MGPCAMDFTTFPMDRHTCRLTLESFNYNKQEVDMVWLNNTPITLLKTPIELPDFTLVGYGTRVDEVVKVHKSTTNNLFTSLQAYPAGIWNELTMIFKFKRRYGWYIMQAYIPTYLTIFIRYNLPKVQGVQRECIQE